MKNRVGLATLLIFAALCGNARGQADFGVVAPQATAAAAGSLIVRNAGPGTLIGFNAANTAAAVTWVLVYDSATVPADGATTPIAAYALAATATAPGNTIETNYTVPVRVFNGLVFVCSSSGPFTKTIITNCFFSVQAQ